MLQIVLGTARLPFLILAPLCVSVAVAYAHYLSIDLNPLDVALCFIAATLAHASVNMLNEHRDHVSGLDANTHKTPFSGGSGALQAFPEHVNTVCYIGWSLLLISVCIGLYFVYHRGLDLVPIGCLGVALVAFYTPHINKLPLVCLIAPGFGFGIVMLVGSFIALTGVITYELIILAFPIFMLTNNLLLLNQYPDAEADRSAGRSHMILRYGFKHGMKAYLYHIIVSVFATLFIVLFFELKTWGILLLFPALLGTVCYFGLKRFIEHNDLSKFVPYLALNVVACLSYPLFLSALLFFI